MALSGPFSVVDDPLGTIDCGDASVTLAPDATLDCGTRTYTVTQDDLDANETITNTATGYGTFDKEAVTSREVTVNVEADQTIALQVTKTPSRTTYTAADQVITYTYTLHNAGNVTLSGPFSVVDVPLGTIDCGDEDLAPGATIDCGTRTYTTTQSDIDTEKTITNTAVGNGVFDEAPVTSPEVTVNVEADQSIALTVTKTASRATYTAAGQVITYTYTLTNAGGVTLDGPFSVGDDPLGKIDCAGDTLAPGATTTCDTATYTTTQADIDTEKTITNTATGHGYVRSEVPVTSEPVTVNVEADPGIAIEVTKTASRATYTAAGQVITYTYTLHNTGTVTLNGPFSVTDDPLGTIDCAGDTLAPGATLDCGTRTYTTTQADLDANKTITNTATGHGQNGKKPVDSVVVTVNVTTTNHPELTIKKTSSTTEFGAVGDAIAYSYELTNSGNVTLTGPFTVTDNKVAVTCPDTASLAPGDHITCTASYAVTQADIDAGKVTNTAVGHASFGQTSVDTAQTVLAVGAKPTPSPSVSIAPTPIESVAGESATPTAHRTATPPATSLSDTPSEGGSAPIFALLICLAFAALALLTVQAQRRSLNR